MVSRGRAIAESGPVLDWVGMERGTSLLAPLTLAVGLLLPGPMLSAQQVEVRLREEGTLVPVHGAIVRLLADTGTVGQGLTNASGRLVLRAPQPGRYRLKVDRIGFIGLQTAAVDLAAGETFPTDLLMPSVRWELPTIEVQTRSRCAPSGPDGQEALALWEEIQKALTANLITTQSAATPLHVREFRRWRQRNGSLLSEYNVSSTVVRGQVYASLDPRTLAESGFLVLDARDSMAYAVPDAALLTSDAFVSTHCFGVAPGVGGLVGLTFEPVPGRKLPEVAGTIWVDQSSGELRYLEYDYLNLPGLLGRAELGGRVEFQRLPSGEWTVSYWHVRTPHITSSEVRATGNVRRELARHIGYLDVGGRVTLAGETEEPNHLAVVRGQVVDSTQDGSGIAGAVITIDGTGGRAVSDPEGRFQLAVSAFGERNVSALHPKLGLLDPAPSVPAVLSLGDTVAASFGVPPTSRFAGALCGRSSDRQAGVVGLVLDAGGQGVSGVEVKASWRTPGGGTREVTARNDRRGLFALCDLPPDEQVTIRVYNRRNLVVETSAEIGFRQYSWIDLWLPEV